MRLSNLLDDKGFTRACLYVTVGSTTTSIILFADLIGARLWVVFALAALAALTIWQVKFSYSPLDGIVFYWLAILSGLILALLVIL